MISKEEQEIDYSEFLKKVEGILEVDEKYRHVHSSESLYSYRRGWIVNARNMRLPDALYLSTENGRMLTDHYSRNFSNCNIDGLLIKPLMDNHVEMTFTTTGIGFLDYEQNNIPPGEDPSFYNYLKLLTCTKVLHMTLKDNLHNVEKSGGFFKHDAERLKDIWNEFEIDSFISVDKKFVFNRKNVVLRKFEEFDADRYNRPGECKGYKIVFSINDGNGELYFSVVPEKDICFIGIRNYKTDSFYVRPFNMYTSCGTFLGLFNYFSMLTKWKPDMGTVGETTYKDIVTEIFFRTESLEKASPDVLEWNRKESQYTYLYETENFYKSVEENIECVHPAFENSYKDIRDTHDPLEEEK